MLLVQTEEQFEAALEMMRKASVIAVDTETRGKKGGMFEHVWHGNRLIGFSTHCKFPGNENYSINFYFPFRHQHDDKVLTLFTNSENLPIELLPKFAEILNRDDVYLKFWHLKFDAQVFRADDLWLTPNIERTDDGMPKAQLVDENISHKLKDVGALLFGDHVKKEEAEIDAIIRKQGGYHKTTPQQMAPYACRDAQLTHDVDPILDEALEVQGLTHLVRREMQFQIVMMEMEWEGIAFDRPLAERLAKQSRMRMREIEDELGFDPQKRDALAHTLFHKHAIPNADGSYRLPQNFDLTLNKSKEFPTGVPQMNEQVLVGLRDPVADLVLEYRGLGKANSTWYEGWIKRLGKDQRLHPTYNHSDKKAKYGTVTSRLSSFIQQMPRNPDAMVKLLLKPEPGHIMVEYDYSQIEYREASIYSDDEQLKAAFINGDDLHQQLADQLGIDRDSAKTIAYTVLFGGQGKALSINMMKQVWLNEKKIVHVSEAEGQEIVNAYYALHPRVKAVSNRAKALAKSKGYVTLWNGRRRHFGPRDDHRKAFNSVLQGGAAQIIEESMLMLHDMRDRYPFRMRVQVHDSLWFSIPLDGFDEYDRIIKTTMEWPTEKFSVPFPVDSKIIRSEELREDQLRGNLLGTRPGGDDGMGSI